MFVLYTKKKELLKHILFICVKEYLPGKTSLKVLLLLFLLLLVHLFHFLNIIDIIIDIMASQDMTNMNEGIPTEICILFLGTIQ